MVNFGRELLTRGYTVDLVVVSSVGALKSIVPAGIRIIDLQSRRMLTALPGLVAYLRRTEPRAIFSTITHANLLTAIASRFVSRNVTTVLRQSNAPLAEPKSSAGIWLSQKLIPHLYQLSDRIIAVSHGVAEQLCTLGPALSRKISVIPTPVLSSEVVSLGDEPIDHPWFAPGEPPVVLAAGRLKRHKGYNTLCEAFSLVRRERPARLVIIGEGSDRKEFEQKVKSLNLTRHVDLPGFKANPFPYMKRAKTFVLSSQYEGLPNVLIQAMAFGTPVVSTDCETGPKEILEGGRLGGLVPVGDASRMASAIVQALDQPKQREAQESVFARFGISQATTGYLELAGLGARCEDIPNSNP